MNAQWRPPEFMFDGRYILVIIWERKQQVSRPVKCTQGRYSKVNAVQTDRFWQSRCLCKTRLSGFSQIWRVLKKLPRWQEAVTLSANSSVEKLIGSLHWTPLNCAVSVKREVNYSCLLWLCIFELWYQHQLNDWCTDHAPPMRGC